MKPECSDTPGQREPTSVIMSDADFAAFAQLIHAKTGIVINDAKRSMLVSRLSRRLRDLGLRDFGSYRKLLASGGDAKEHGAFISAITTNVTSFFREPGHFDVLAGMVPDFAARAQAGDRIRIWSAGCSSGEEPYSIAMTLKENWATLDRADLRILATDIDPGMVATARRGIYTAQQVGEDPSALLRQNVKRQSDGGDFAIDPSLRHNLRFEELNLLGPWPFNGMFDVIFCRNVVIYFDAPTRMGLWRRFAERLRPGGTLFVGHSERVDGDLENLLEPAGVTQYRRTDHPASASYSRASA
ncbi:MAG: chemotaxis signal relay system methyltransferase CheR [Rhodobacteraceae bacterium HLUCCO18]|nr:MAG: chemotaxis signal relay system methyltransferase CheR [Rhodobacteraceae bacterium HLUCCO18]